MATQYYSHPRDITIENTNVRIEVGRLQHSIKRDLRNFFGKYGLDRETGMLDDIDIPAGMIEDMVIRRGLVRLTIGTEEIRFTGNSPVDSFPDFAMGDLPGEVDLYDEVVKTLVDKNQFLANQYPFGMVFAQYLSMIEMEDQKTKEDAAKEKNEEPPKKEKPASDDDEEVSTNPLSSQDEDTSTPERISGSELSGKKG